MTTRNRLIAALALIATGAAGSAFAQEATYELPAPVASVTTRAAVMDEVLNARAAGTLQLGEFDLQANGTFVATRSRDAVRAETLAAARQGLTALVGRDDNSFDGRIPTATVDVRLVAAAR